MLAALRLLRHTATQGQVKSEPSEPFQGSNCAQGLPRISYVDPLHPTHLQCGGME